MQDGQGRQIGYLRLSVTEQCNYRCGYCMPAGAPCANSPRPSVERLEELAQAAVDCGVEKIRITGGEPLIRDDILDVCSTIAEINGVKELCLTTNGHYLSELAEPLRQAGVSRVNISIDSLRPERFAQLTGGGDFHRVWAGILEAERVFGNVKLDVVLMGGINDDEILDFVDLTRYHPWAVRFIELMPMGACANWDKGCFLSGDAVLACCPQLVEGSPQGVARRFRLPDAVGAVGLIAPLSHTFCHACNRIRITADGYLKGCLHAKEELDLTDLHGFALQQAITQGILQKPASHHLTQRGSDTPRRMHRIGG
ncbi:GTP 3',8-cyclase MoaA [Bengtsoniella intestinalis]|uniref:GTP 3',8-cyclase MoaA n=1 Tax=Bengtsoniella intestinalis TaxID=3073143 RepID=UPI00391EFEB4